MSKHKSRDVWNIVGSALVPFLDRRTGHDRRHEADAAHDGPSPWIDKRKGDRRQASSAALLYISALFIGAPQAAEKVSFEATLAYTANSVQLRGDIAKPAGEGPFPAVVLMHGCGGWQPAVRHAMRAYAEYLVDHGFVVLDLDSFGPRSLGGGKVCESIKQQRDALTYRTSDAYDALKYLRTLSYVDGKNIFLMGQSNGGSVAINVAKGDTPVKPASVGEEGYRAVAAYYPWCGSFGGRKVELESPLMIFAGSDDDWTPASECEGVKSTKANLEVKTYPGAAHSFDLNIIPQRYLGKMLGHHKEAAEDSRQRMVNFFVEHTVGVDWKKVRLSKAAGELAANTQP